MARMDKKVAVVGAGNMGGALIASLVQSNLLATDSVTAVDISESILSQHREALGVDTARDLDGALDDQDVIILGVKPQVWRGRFSSFSVSSSKVSSCDTS